MTANEERAARFGELLPEYTDTDEYTNLADVLTDAMHFARLHGYDLAKLWDTVEMHFWAETGADLPRWPFESLPAEVSVAVDRVVDYLWRDEMADYLETSPQEGRQGHVFESLRIVRRWQVRQKRGAIIR